MALNGKNKNYSPSYLNYSPSFYPHLHTTRRYVTLKSMVKNKNGQDYSSFASMASWGFIDVPISYKRSRLPVPDDLRNKRKAHMQKLHTEGNPYTWIAKLYEMDKEQVRRIVNDLPNN